MKTYFFLTPWTSDKFCVLSYIVMIADRWLVPGGEIQNVCGGMLRRQKEV